MTLTCNPGGADVESGAPDTVTGKRAADGRDDAPSPGKRVRFEVTVKMEEECDETKVPAAEKMEDETKVPTAPVPVVKAEEANSGAWSCTKMEEECAVATDDIGAPLGDFRDVVIYGDYGECVRVLDVDAPKSEEQDAELCDLPLKLLVESDGKVKEGVPKVRVWGMGQGGCGKYWEVKGTERQLMKASEGEWLPLIIANELQERIDEEGEGSVPVNDFLEEACNEEGDSLLIAEAQLLHARQALFRDALRAKRGVAQGVIRGFYLKVVKAGLRKTIARTFTRDCVTLDEARNTPFEDLSNKLREKPVVDAAQRMLQKVIQLANFARVKPLISGVVNVKIYLAAYMIAARPNHVFEDISDLEQKVLDAAEPMLEAFHRTAVALASGESWNKVRTKVAPKLPSLLCTYLCTFKEWKLVDEKKLAGRLTHALKGLEDAEMGLKGGDADTKIRRELQAQQKKLREKLAQIAGEKAVQEHDAERAARLALPATVSRDADAPADGAAPTGHVGGMTNEQLAHELLLDKEFRLDEKAGMSNDKLVHTKIRETFERAFWESLVEDLASPPFTYARVLSVLSEIKTGIEGLSERHPEKDMIAEVVDMETITTCLRRKTFDDAARLELFDGIVNVLLSMHDRMRSPQRRQETVEQWGDIRKTLVETPSEDIATCARVTCNTLEFVLDRVHVIRVDTANNKLRAITPVIREHGVEYERSHFMKKLQSGDLTLERTEAWFTYVLSEVMAGENPRVSLQDLRDGSKQHEAYRVVVNSAMVGLIADFPNWGGPLQDPVDEDVVPETMRLDLLRIKALNMHFKTEVVSSILVATAKTLCSARGVWTNEFAKKVIDVVVKHPPRVEVFPRATMHLVKEVLQEVMDEAQLKMYGETVRKNLMPSSEVYKAMFRVVKKAFYSLCRDGDVPSPSPIPSCPNVAGSVFAKNLGTDFKRIVEHNIKVHVTRYNSVITKIVGRFPGA